MPDDIVLGPVEVRPWIDSVDIDSEIVLTRPARRVATNGFLLGALGRLQGRAPVPPLIAQHHGRVVKLMGDCFLVEFTSIVDTLSCAPADVKAVFLEPCSEAAIKLNDRVLTKLLQ